MCPLSLVIALAVAAPAVCGPPAVGASGGTLTPTEEQALAAYGELPAFEDVALSPDGSRLAYVGTLGDTRHVLVRSGAQSTP